ncbi:alpha/beta fold hydrolase [Algoriphagus marinus]|uniref:alpha/beta fold hydrolase n=1 Tax=Algoriphagus marinus TaxID=1925762 RepID=UPI00094BBD1D|nr:alpha/beta hydrolase [Algoriphagus marinus]
MIFIKTKWGKLAYTSKGDGYDVFLIFHGFGQSHEDMLPFESLLNEHRRFIFIDVFYHGRSAWRDPNLSLSKSIWKEIISELMRKEEFSEFHLIGYSMGGKFSLITFELFPEKVKSLKLLAPDGIKTGLWYSLGTYPGFLHQSFKRVVFKPKLFFNIIKGMEQVGLSESSLTKFVKNEMKTRSKRAQVYLTWRVFGGFQPQLGTIITAIRNRKTPIKLYVGEYDKMITGENLKRFSSKIPHLELITLPVGHGKLIEETVKHILKQT